MFKAIVFLFTFLILVNFLYATGDVFMYRGSGVDEISNLDIDGNYVYISGYTYSEGEGQSDVILLKLDKNLNLLEKKVLGGASFEGIVALDFDSTFLYGSGSTSSEGFGSSDILLTKFYKNLSINKSNFYGTVNSEGAKGIIVDDNNIYMTAQGTNIGQGSNEIVFLKFDKDLNLLDEKTYGGASSDYAFSIVEDNDNFYFLGETYSEGQGSDDILFLKLNKSMSLLVGKRYGGASNDQLEDLVFDGSYIYGYGYTCSEGSFGCAFLLLKLDTDLNLINKTYIDNSTITMQWGHSLVADDNYLYTIGTAMSGGYGSYDVIISRFNKSLHHIESIILGGTGTDSITKIVIDGDYLYLGGSTRSKYPDYDITLFKINKNFSLNNAQSDDGTFNISFVDVIQSTSNLVFANSALTFSDVTVFGSGVSNLIYNTSNLNVSYSSINTIYVSNIESEVFSLESRFSMLMSFVLILLFLF